MSSRAAAVLSGLWSVRRTLGVDGCLCRSGSLTGLLPYRFPDRFAGLQVAVIEFARNVLDLKEAHSAEFDAATPTPAVVFMPEGSKTHKGGTMRLGARKTILQTMDCITARLYQVHWAAN